MRRPRPRRDYPGESRLRRIHDLQQGVLIGMGIVIVLICLFAVAPRIGLGLRDIIVAANSRETAPADAPLLTAVVPAQSPTPLFGPTSAGPLIPGATLPAASDPGSSSSGLVASNPEIIKEATEAALTGNPLAAYSIPALSVYSYNGGTIVKERRVYTVDSYSQWSFSYSSDGITVTGLMDIPNGPGRLPVILVLHGGIDQGAYKQGDDTVGPADILARNGYVALMPDYRTYNNTGGSGSPLKIPWAIDVMNLIQALPTLPEADPNRVGVMGHSRGGGVASYIMVLSPKVKAFVLYAPLSTDQGAVWDIYKTKFGTDWPDSDALIYGSPTTNPAGYKMVSPSSYLSWITAPIQIHHGTNDNVLPYQWSVALQASLQALGKNSQLFTYEGAGHVFTGSDFQLLMNRSLAFFDQYVKGQ